LLYLYAQYNWELLMRTISLRLDGDVDALLMAYCAQHGLTQTEVVRKAIERFTSENKPTPAELAAKFGLIGGPGSGISDLGENHSKHLRVRLRAKLLNDSIPK